MAQITIAPKTGYIKIVDWSAAEGCPGPHLEAVLRQCLAKVSLNKERQWRRTPDHPVRRFIDEHSDFDQCLVGALRQFEGGKNIEVVRPHADDPAAQMEVDTAAVPPSEDGEPQEHVDATLFFAVSEDRLAYVQGGSLTFHALADYLNWFLRSSGGFKSGNIRLIDETPKEVAKRIEATGVKEIRLGASLADIFARKDVDEDVGVIDLTEGFFPGLIPKSLYAKMAGFEHVETSGLRATVAFSAKTKAGAETKSFMKALAIGLQGETKSLTIVLQDGKEIRGGKLITKGKLDAQNVDGIAAATSVWTGLKALLDGRLNKDVNEE
ncbi:hypothetical protein [Luteolibacter sp. Populi]|uniref:hypothetical protein n=1 Tax=Luteolibacter sp. Populi TaxID=3230487 RepID=UPI003467B2AB